MMQYVILRSTIELSARGEEVTQIFTLLYKKICLRSQQLTYDYLRSHSAIALSYDSEKIKILFVEIITTGERTNSMKRKILLLGEKRYHQLT
ncbi:MULTISPECIES: hypothetical protein [Nostocales]|uniref:Uncharacterized protein n=3 Tax=Nostocales TaxID=1161 RepID=A0A0C1N8B5_9CYAN|nr:hypothetical protein [Tolypothrix bouteillei]KAF3886930.1 hypothetical protein DA73_0400016615 [Tolypothrix bouteillei VB521301]